MRRFAAVRPSVRRPGRAPGEFCQCRANQTGRDRPREPVSALKVKTFAAKVNRSLGLGAPGTRLEVNEKKKIVETSAGNLPVSPVMDPAWMEARTAYRTPKAKARKDEITGRFRRKLLQNPYAQALATPVRHCPITSTNLPRYFLQDFKAVMRPDTGDFWWTPGDMELPFTSKESVEQKEDARAVAGAPDIESDAKDTLTPSASQKDGPSKIFIAAPSSYALARKPLLKSMGGKRKKTPHGDAWKLLIGRRLQFQTKGVQKRMVWREDMDDFVLENLRRNTMKYLLYFADLHGKDNRGYIAPLKNWNAVVKQKQRGCLLWYYSKSSVQSQDGHAHSDPLVLEEFTTFDVPGAKYEKKLPVHDLRRLLGPKHFAILQENALFRDNSLFIVSKQRSISLQLYLWKLQAYMAESPLPDNFAEAS